MSADEYLNNGDPLQEATLDAIKRCDATLLGAMGLPNVRWPNAVKMTPQIDLREKLDLYQGIRPIKLFHESHSPLRVPNELGTDFVIMIGLALPRMRIPALAFKSAWAINGRANERTIRFVWPPRIWANSRSCFLDTFRERATRITKNFPLSICFPST